MPITTSQKRERLSELRPGDIVRIHSKFKRQDKTVYGVYLNQEDSGDLRFYRFAIPNPNTRQNYEGEFPDSAVMSVVPCRTYNEIHTRTVTMSPFTAPRSLQLEGLEQQLHEARRLNRGV